MTCPAVIEVITPGPPGPGGGAITLTGPAILGREAATPGPPVAIPLGSGLSIVAGALTAAGATNLAYDPATRVLSSSTGDDVALPLASTAAAGLVPPGWVSGTEAAILPHIHGNLAGIVYEHVRPIGVAIGALVPYHIVGNQGDTDRVQIIAADAGDPQTMPASGILPIGLANNADGHGAVVGPITGVDTAAYAPGTTLYVAVGGGLTATRPVSNVQMVAVVGRSHASTGSVVPLIGPVLAPVGYTGAYADLSGKPTIPATPADVGAAVAFAGYQTGRWIMPVPGDFGLGSALTANTIQALPFEVKRQVRVSGLGGRVATVAAGGNVQFAVYDSTAAGVINAPLRSSASLSAGTAQFVSDTSMASFLLLPGVIYWWAVASDASPVMQAVLNSNPNLARIIGADIASASSSATATISAYSYAATFGTWPNLSAAAATAITNNRNAYPFLLVSAFT